MHIDRRVANHAQNSNAFGTDSVIEDLQFLQIQYYYIW